MMKKLVLPLIFLLGLAGCAPQQMRLVDTVDAPQFVAMSQAMRPAMLRKNLVDHHGSWYSPSLSLLPRDAGAVLVGRLSPSFLESDVFEARTFRASLGRRAVVKEERFTAAIRKDGRLVRLELVAVADWDGDGRDDWLIRCQHGEADEPRVYREYFLAVTDLKAAVLQPRVLLVQDSFGGRKTVIAEPYHSEFAGSHAEEFLQGQTVVTQAPAADIDRKLEQSRVTSSSLSQ
jgi:hypothetical protein